MKNIKEMIIPILLGFTLVNSLYGTFKISELERKIRDVETSISNLQRHNMLESIIPDTK